MISPKNFILSSGFKPKKLLGQNFLVHAEGGEKIVRFAGIQPGDSVLEIGPGLAALTTALLKAGANVTSIEKDDRLVEELKLHGPQDPNFHLIHQDALQFQFDQLPHSTKKWKVAANLPYSVSTPLLEMLLNQIDQIESMVLLLQEEVVDRICAPSGGKEYGRLSIWVQMLCEVERGFRVPRGSFFPVPDVESRLLRLIPRAVPLVPLKDQKDFLNLVALAFRHRRKTVRNALKDEGVPTEKIESALAVIKIDLLRRAETLTIQNFYALLHALKQTI